MAELTTDKRERLQDTSFAYIDKDGERHLPINDESHVRNAIARFNQTDSRTAAPSPRPHARSCPRPAAMTSMSTTRPTSRRPRSARRAD